MIKSLVLPCLFTAAVFLLAGCLDVSIKVAPWEKCCQLWIPKDQTSGSESYQALLKLSRYSSFDGDGRNGLTGMESRRAQEAQKDVEAYDPKMQPKDYFSHMGMVCLPLRGGESARTRCEAEVPVWVRCAKLPFFSGPLPEELQGLRPALLQVSVEMSNSAVLGVGSNVAPYPGDRLCHR